MCLRNLFAESVGLPDSTAMLITRLRLRVSYAYDRRGFSFTERAHLSRTHLMLINELSCPRPAWRTIVVQPAILYVENNLMLAQLVGDLLDLGGWHVWRVPDGTTAQTFLRGEQRYALLLVDNELRDTTGLEVVKFARSLPHRESLPIMLFSIEDCEREAKEAGANEFLRKPHDLFLLVETIRRLIKG